jgi:pantoate--beta-alanine ligase
MVRDLDIPVKVVPCAIVREKDGLAMSSRNVYLSSEDRLNAPILFRALKAAKRAAESKKVKTSREVVEGITRLIDGSGANAHIDYIAVKDAESLADVAALKGRVVIALAVFFGSTRLIDNIEVTVA